MTRDSQSPAALQPTGDYPVRQYSQSAMRALHALETLAFAPATAPQLAQRIGVGDRAARRILHTFDSARYVQQRSNDGPEKHEYSATLRLLALAVQLGRHHPVIEHAQRQVIALRQLTGLSAYAAAPAHDQVIVVASEGLDAPTLWTVLAARESAVGAVLLAHDDRWRHEVEPGEYADRVAAMTRHRGYVLRRRDFGPLSSLAAAAKAPDTPEVAIAVVGPLDQLSVVETATAETVMSVAAKMAR